MAYSLATGDKALQVNLDPTSYGTFAEIGAGQEVARWFFRAGNASKTVAKTMSAYDMTFSDAIYGAEENNRYVCESRLRRMLAKEFDLLMKRLGSSRGETTRFFAFANTVASRRPEGLAAGHGWLGVRFQHEPMAEPSEAAIHVRLLDPNILDQQEAVGRVGVNLVHGCLHLSSDPRRVVGALGESLERHRLEVDMVQLDGPAFGHADNRLLSLLLVQNGLADAVVFSPDGRMVHPADAFYGHPLLVQRGRFRPVTLAHTDMQILARQAALKALGSDEAPLVSLMEITTHNLLRRGEVDSADFLGRVDLLTALGYHVMVSNYAEYHRVSEFLAKYTKERVFLAMGIAHLASIFDPRWYERLPGGIMAALGHLFRPGVQALVYPAYSLHPERPAESATGMRCLNSAESFAPSPGIEHLYRHLRASGSIVDLEGADPECLAIQSDEVFSSIQSGADDWERLVPAPAAALIKRDRMFQRM